MDSSTNPSAPLIAHIIYRLDIGGLENGLVNLINRLPAERYRHAIICLTDYTEFRQRIQRPDVEVYALHKREGQDWSVYLKLWRLLRQLRPHIVHTRNLATLECQWPAFLAGVRHRVHGEHGWDVGDLEGANRKYQFLRRVFRPLISRYIALSAHQRRYLQEKIGVRTDKITHICNGVDTQRFRPFTRQHTQSPTQRRTPLPIEGFAPPGTLVIGTIGRMQTVKDQLTLVWAFLHLLTQIPDGRNRLRLVMIGDGPLRNEALTLLQQAGAADLAWLPGARDDVSHILRGLDVFVLPSLAEGISNTILEAMASGLPVVATRVGGNPDLIVEEETGQLVPANNPQALAAALSIYVKEPATLQAHGQAARRRIEQHYSMETMVAGYLTIYDTLLNHPPVSLPLTMRS